MIPIVIVSALILSSVSGRSYRHETSKDWDVILFTQNWPVTECLQLKQDNSYGDCNSADYSQWTVHGMWPTKLGTKGPGFCDDSLKFELEDIESILEQLRYRWLSIKGGFGEDKSFWKHEWQKHGTCAVSLDDLDSELKYFSKGLDWNSQYSMRTMLQNIGLNPGGYSESVDTLYNNLHNLVGSNPIVSCFTRKNTGKTYLIDIRLCFDKSLSLVDCDGVERGDDEHPLTQDCPQGTTIYYPDQDELLYNDDEATI